jgi:hypothetical protein
MVEMEFAKLAQEVTALVVPLMPYLTKAGEKAAEAVAQKLGEAGWEKAKTLWGRLWQRTEGKEAAREAVQEVLADPSDEEAVVVLRRQIKRLLAEDASFAREIAAAVEEFRAASPQHFQAQITGSGAIAQGQGTVAAGAGGVAIGGSVHGGVIVTGHGNVVGKPKGDEWEGR